MPFDKQKGILDPNSNPVTDANVIMTAAIVGHAYERLSAGKNCKFDVEVQDPVNLDKDNTADITLHRSAVNKINLALAHGGLNQKAQLGITPHYYKDGKSVIIGGTGDKSVTDADRYNPPNAWNSDEATLLFQLATGTAKDAKGAPIATKLGYQGRGAYTGFIDGRKNGQSNLMSTYRFKVPDNGRRWVPNTDSWKIANNKDMGNPFGTGANEREAWGIIVDNSTQIKCRDEQGMYFADEDKARGTAVTLTDDDVVGYVHGMIQAIYDVEFHKHLPNSTGGGTPYEIAVGNDTSKLASCFACSVFMDSTGYPASSTHLGRGESWCILHGNGTSPTQNSTRDALNDKWAAYCQTIVTKGMDCLVNKNGNVLNEDHRDSFTKLQAYLAKNNTPQNKYLYANLILDALTVHNSEYNRINAAIVDPPPVPAVH